MAIKDICQKAAADEARSWGLPTAWRPDTPAELARDIRAIHARGCERRIPSWRSMGPRQREAALDEHVADTFAIRGLGTPPETRNERLQPYRTEARAGNGHAEPELTEDEIRGFLAGPLA